MEVTHDIQGSFSSLQIGSVPAYWIEQDCVAGFISLVACMNSAVALREHIWISTLTL